MEPELVLLDWTETTHGTQPTPDEVYRWLDAHGYDPVGQPKVYRNGTLQAVCKSPNGLPEAWPSFTPPVLTAEDRLGGHIRNLLTAETDLKRTPESQRTPEQRALLATMALLKYGYGVTDE